MMSPRAAVVTPEFVASLPHFPNNVASYAVSVGALTAIVAVHEAGHLVTSLAQGIKVTGFSIGFGPALLKWRSEGKQSVEYALRLFPLGGFVSFPEYYNETSPNEPLIVFDDKDLLQNRPVQQRMLVICGGIIANLMLAWSCLCFSIHEHGYLERHISPGVIISSIVDLQGPGAAVGLKVGDSITDIEGLGNIPSSQIGVDATVRTIRIRPNLPTTITVLRKGSSTSERVTIVPGAQATFGGAGSIGVKLAPRVTETTIVRASSILNLIELSSREFTEILIETVGGVVKVAEGVAAKLTGHGGSRGSVQGMAQLTGPLGVLQAGADIAANKPEDILTFVADVSINLAVVNALPLPALDGGQLAFVIVEIFRGKRMEIRDQENITFLALAALLVLSALLTAGGLK